MSDKKFDPKAWLPQQEPAAPRTAPKVVSGTNDLADQIEIVTQRIEAAAMDITGGYEEWRNIGFALVDALGEGGREIFHRISRFSPKYDAAFLDSQYSNWVNRDRNGVTYRTFFEKAKENGISISFPSKTYNSSVPGHSSPKDAPNPVPSPPLGEEIEEMEDSEGIFTLPTFTDKFQHPIPEFLQKVIAVAGCTQEADMLLLGALGVISACLPGISGIYDRHLVYPNFYVFVTAGASAGKGSLKYTRYLVDPIHDEIREKSEADKADYEAKMEAYSLAKPSEKKNMEKPKEAVTKMLLIPANSSATAMCQALHDNDGCGLMFESEGDSLSNTLSSDYGDYSDDFRKAFHHEKISYYRRKNNEYAEIKQPRLSTVLSGTPKQIQNLIPDAENGLLSRFVFYRLPTRMVWNDVFAGGSDFTLDDYFHNLGLEFKDFYDLLLASPPCRFSVTPEQAAKFNTFFSAAQVRYSAAYGEDLIPSIRRLGLVTFRMAMVFSALRFTEDGAFGEDFVCLDEDFDNTMCITRAVLEHIVSVYCALPQTSAPQKPTNAGGTLIKQRFWDALPGEFDTKTFNSLATSQNLSVKTAEKYIRNWCKAGQLIHVAQGKYAKADNKA